jgi:hypothetical protein
VTDNDSGVQQREIARRRAEFQSHPERFIRVVGKSAVKKFVRRIRRDAQASISTAAVR